MSELNTHIYIEVELPQTVNDIAKLFGLLGTMGGKTKAAVNLDNPGGWKITVPANHGGRDD